MWGTNTKTVVDVNISHCNLLSVIKALEHWWFSLSRSEILHLGLGCTGSGQQGLSCAWWSIHQNSLWWLDAQILKLLFVVHGQNNRLHQLQREEQWAQQLPNCHCELLLVTGMRPFSSQYLLDLFVKATNVTVLLCGPLIHFHGLNSRVILSG